jgi:protoporphyrinogen oxidase
MFDYIIIGGGISGLYCAYSLLKKTTNLLIVEKSHRLGGRIETRYFDGYHLEMGAGRISSSHRNIINLIEELDMEKDLIQFPNVKSYVNITPQNGNYQIEKIVNLQETDFYKILNSLIDRLKDPHFHILAQNYTLFGLIERVYGVDKAVEMVNQFGYHGDFVSQNAVDGLRMFEGSFSGQNYFYGLKGGMSSIIKRLEQLLEKKIRLKTCCLDIIKNNDHFVCKMSTGDIVCRKIVLAVPKINLLKFNILNKQKLNTVKSKPLMRIYAIFSKINGKVWFDFLNGVNTTKTIVGQLIPVNKEKGILMIYCDSDNAELLYSFKKQKILKKELFVLLKKIFGSIVTKPIKITSKYWGQATHLWKPGTDSNEVGNSLINPSPNIYIIGETYSPIQGWSEGGISTVNKFLAKHT